MPRRPNVDRPIHLNITIPESVRAQLDLHLFSELEGRVPHGAYSRFVCERVQEYFSWKRLNLSLYGLPEGYFIFGPKEMLEIVADRLDRLPKEEQK